MFFNNNSTSITDDYRKVDAIINTAVRQLEAKVQKHNDKIRKSEEWKNFETDFYANNPYAEVRQKVLADLKRVKGNIQIVIDNASPNTETYYLTSALGEVSDAADRVKSDIERECRNQKFDQFKFQEVPWGIRGQLKDLITLSEHKDGDKIVEEIVKKINLA